MAYVDLDRRFVAWDEKDPDSAEHLTLLRSKYSGISWTELLENRRVVVLAEAGGGKTRELQEQMRLRSAAGAFAFYATVQDVASEGLDNALAAASRRSVKAWRVTDQPAWFFIDSIDEAKLDGIRLAKALRKLADGISCAPGRAYVVLSGRVTDWEFRADLRRFNELLPVPGDPTQPPPPDADTILVGVLRGERTRKRGENPKAIELPRVMLMAPLDEERVRSFAAGQGIEKLDPFIDAIEAGDLWSLARRPLDLGWLVEYWRRHGRFGPLAAMIEASLQERLQETNALHALNDPICQPARKADQLPASNIDQGRTVI